MSFFRKNSINFVGRQKPVCFLIAAQSSRGGYEYAVNHGGVYTLYGIAEGNEIERASTNVISIYADADLKNNMQALMQVLKGRDCEEMEEPITVKVNAKNYYIGDNLEDSNYEDSIDYIDDSSNDLPEDYDEED